MPSSYVIRVEFLDDRDDITVVLSMADRIAAKRKTNAELGDPEFDTYATWLAAKRDGFDGTYDQWAEAVALLTLEEAPGKN